jgi:hypothetical protein
MKCLLICVGYEILADEAASGARERETQFLQSAFGLS